MKNIICLLIGIFLLQSCSLIKSTRKITIDQILDNGTNWKKVNHDEKTIYYIDKSETSSNISEISQKTIKGINQAKKYLGEEYLRPINIVTVDNFEEIEKILNKKTSGHAFPQNDLVVEISGVSETCHEKFHVLSINKWGSTKSWLSEGAAVSCDGEWWGTELHELANYLLENKKLIPINKLTKSNKSFLKENNLFSYPQSGSMVQFIEEKYGREKLLHLWKSGDFQKSIGKSNIEFESEWQKEIKNYSTSGIDYLDKINYN